MQNIVDASDAGSLAGVAPPSSPACSMMELCSAFYSSRAEVATPNLPPEGPQGVRFTLALLWRTQEIPGCIF